MNNTLHDITAVSDTADAADNHGLRHKKQGTLTREEDRLAVNTGPHPLNGGDRETASLARHGDTSPGQVLHVVWRSHDHRS